MSYSVENTVDYSIDSPRKDLEFDVVVIGSGAGGGIASEILSRSGLKVLIVEEGPLKTAQDFNMQEKTAYADLYQENAGRQTLDKGIQILQGRSVGGSTTVNWTSSFRTPEQTLIFWEKEFSVEGLRLNQLSPWFDWVEKRLHVAKWQVPPNRNNQLLADGLKSLGWKHDIIARNVNNCANLGYCGMGCPINAKQSMLVSTIPKALKNGAQLIHRARVESLIIENNQVKGVWLSAMDSHGQVKEKNVSKVRAKQVVLSAGAIGSPAILLRSKAPDPYARLGTRTFLHPVAVTVAQMPEKVEAFSGAPQSVYSDQFLWRDGVAGELGYKIEVPPMHPVISSTLMIRHAKAHTELIRKFPYYQTNLSLLRDGFNQQSQGGQVILDENGYPSLDYKITHTVWRALRASMLSMTELQFAAGAKQTLALHLDANLQTNWQSAKNEIEQLPADKLRWQTMSAHVMGGCGMGSDEKHSVVNSLGEHHQIENLTVIDGSLFPTSLGVNPQLTIYTMAAKLSSLLAKRMKAKLPSDLANLGLG